MYANGLIIKCILINMRNQARWGACVLLVLYDLCHKFSLADHLLSDESITFHG